jgi:hypothetical protein
VRDAPVRCVFDAIAVAHVRHRLTIRAVLVLAVPRRCHVERAEQFVRENLRERFAIVALRDLAEHDVVGVAVGELRPGRKLQTVAADERQ